MKKETVRKSNTGIAIFDLLLSDILGPIHEMTLRKIRFKVAVLQMLKK